VSCQQVWYGLVKNCFHALLYARFGDYSCQHHRTLGTSGKDRDCCCWGRTEELHCGSVAVGLLQSVSWQSTGSPGSRSPSCWVITKVISITSELESISR
jgi:hypothetical protein